MPKEFSEKLITQSGVREDWVDLRDQDYVPSLSILRESVSIEPRLAPVDLVTGLRKPVFGLRDQGESGRCVGFALANLIDLQRNLQRQGLLDAADNHQLSLRDLERDIVSADMLYHMAYFHDRYPDLEKEAASGDEGLRTIRSGIKGFYHHGACLDWPEKKKTNDPARWQSTFYNSQSPDKLRRFPSVEQAKKAREISLGAYFRLSSVLNHFHAALNETEGVLVTANIHDGWLKAVPENGGKIEWPPQLGKMGTHAFVLTGYDAEGFHVLNSWGATWGGYKKQAGIALWRYEDWAQNVIDGWVLRLGVKAPAAFGVSTGERGTKGVIGSVRAGSTPCLELVGHYMHLDDGLHVSTGAYPSFKNSWARTEAYLRGHLDPKSDFSDPAQKKYRGLLLWIPGSLEGIKPAFSAAVDRKAAIKAAGLYPYSIFWCNSFVEKSLEVLEFIFKGCKEQAGAEGAQLDDLIEQRVQGIGRAFWRDIEMSARRAVRGTGELPHEPDETDTPKRIAPGQVTELLADLLKLKDDMDCELHLVAEGAGALVVHEMLSWIEEDASKDPKDRLFCRHATRDLFDTVHLVHPAIGMPRANRRLVPLIETMNGPISGKRKRASTARTPNVQPLLETDAQPAARIYVPTSALEELVHFGSYGKSILHLVSRSFEDRYPPPEDDDTGQQPYLRDPRVFLGMAEIADDEEFPARGAIYRLNRIKIQTGASDRVSQTEFLQDPTITDSILETIKAMRSKDFQT